jgi:hypothetical protein
VTRCSARIKAADLAPSAEGAVRVCAVVAEGLARGPHGYLDNVSQNVETWKLTSPMIFASAVLTLTFVERM